MGFSNLLTTLVECFITFAILFPSISQAQNSPQDYLNPHNEARRQVGVGPLRWDNRLAAYAQNYANQRIGDCGMIHSHGPYGENLAAAYPQLNADRAVKMWVDERQWVRCNNGWYFITCNYDPPAVWNLASLLSEQVVKLTMYKQSPGRNHRSKGIKVKNVLQICLLLAVCFWLIYQVKHSHDKKKEFDENDTKTPTKTESSNELVKLGRKDLLPRGIEGLDTVNEKHREKPENETVEEEEGNKPEVEDLEENNTKKKNDEQKEDGEDEVDDHDQEKSDVEADQEEDVVDEDKEIGEDNEKETDERREDNEKETDERGEENEKETDERGKDNEKETENDSQVEEENSLEDHDHDKDSSSSHEAREEHYKADDASSAVTHNTVVTTTENESGKLEQEAEHAAEAKNEVGVNNIMQINAGQTTTVALKVEDVSTQTLDLSLQNGTQAVNQEYNVTVGDTTSGVSDLSISSSQQNNFTDMADDNQIDSNLTVSSKNDELDSTPVDSSNVSGEISVAEKVVQGNATVEAVDNNATEVEKADTTSEEIGTTDEGVDASIVENLGEVQDDLIDTSDSSTHLEEKHIRTDVETLPEIQTEGNMEDAAAE
ncbi:hypothetical protein K7X08_008958 [Anisodus acutangulus]|uniref:SCP domain-containing protein n=1 Tax=Anisodus acutangulus TaxID=402998 RepID=A0A9Q1MYE6_9SOLA|nr:hypothetical protein K7X08_008958 [Anisodus acutangulus]